MKMEETQNYTDECKQGMPDLFKEPMRRPYYSISIADTTISHELATEISKLIFTGNVNVNLNNVLIIEKNFIEKQELFLKKTKPKKQNNSDELEVRGFEGPEGKALLRERVQEISKTIESEEDFEEDSEEKEVILEDPLELTISHVLQSLSDKDPLEEVLDTGEDNAWDTARQDPLISTKRSDYLKQKLVNLQGDIKNIEKELRNALIINN